MRLLVLGGTAWLGAQIARTSVAAGHDVTCLARGTGVPEGVRLIQADRDSASALDTVDDTQWDAVTDVARQPGHVRRAVRALEPVAARYVLVSTANVYASQAQIGADGDAERLPPLESDVMTDAEDYGSAKVACEDAVLDAFGAGRGLIARSGLIGGPGDPTQRSTYWPWRYSRRPRADDRVLAPDASHLPTGLIDVRDLAAWLVRCAEQGTSGVYNTSGIPIPLPEHLAAARRAAGSDARTVFVDPSWLIEQGVREWSGPRSLPLWLAARDWYGMNARSSERAVAAGLIRRPLEETLADGLAWRVAQPEPDALSAGLTDAEERMLLETLG